jgi:hypothetical protein
MADENRVQHALKAAIEFNLAREAAISQGIDQLIGAWHSNGVIFSRSGNGTPFSNGIIFSKTGQGLPIAEGDPAFAAAEAVVRELGALDEAAFSAFTDRLLRLKQVKTIGLIAEE